MHTKHRPFNNQEVANVFESYANDVRAELLFLRQLMYDVASETPGVGELKETLKWGQPSYMPAKAKIGTTVRLGQIPAEPGSYALYFHCQTTLVDTFKEIHPNEFKYQGNRAIIFNINTKILVPELKDCIALALTYHLSKKRC